MIARGRGQDHQHRISAKRIGAAKHRAVYRDQGRNPEPDARHVCRTGHDMVTGGTRSHPAISAPSSTRPLIETPEFYSLVESSARLPRRWGEVNELVGAAVFLASDASSFVNGHTLYVDGGIVASI